MALWNVSKLDKYGCLVAIIIIFGMFYPTDLNALKDVKYTYTKKIVLLQ